MAKYRNILRAIDYDITYEAEVACKSKQRQELMVLVSPCTQDLEDKTLNKETLLHTEHK